jgi:glycosyltransferase involved in cell wall biosynthesis
LGGFVAAKVARELKAPFFITEHNFWDIESCATNIHRKRHYQEAIKGISGWIAVSDRLHKRMKAIFPDAPVITVHNGAETIPNALKENPRPTWLVDRQVVLCAAFFYKIKMVPLLIQAFDSVAERYPDARLLVIGDGDDKPAVLAALDSAIHRSQIILLGQLAHREVLQYMVWCDIFANIGIREPFATVFLEAMMASKPIIYASDGGITDVVTTGIHGLEVHPNDQGSAADALSELLSDVSLRHRLGAQARRLAETELTCAENARHMLGLFEETCRSWRNAH